MADGAKSCDNLSYQGPNSGLTAAIIFVHLILLWQPRLHSRLYTCDQVNSTTRNSLIRGVLVEYRTSPSGSMHPMRSLKEVWGSRHRVQTRLHWSRSRVHLTSTGRVEYWRLNTGQSSLVHHLLTLVANSADDCTATESGEKHWSDFSRVMNT